MQKRLYISITPIPGEFKKNCKSQKIQSSTYFYDSVGTPNKIDDLLT